MSGFMQGDHSGKARPNSAQASKGNPGSVLAGKLSGTSNYMGGTHSGKAAPLANGNTKSGRRN